MTLVVAGFENDGSIVFCADSLITTRSQGVSVRLTSKFRKIIPLEIIIRIPEFDNEGRITRYIDTLPEHRCLIALSGSTLVAQHIINNIQGHLKRIKYTISKATYDNGLFKDSYYKLIMGCEDNTDIEKTYWDDDVFINPHVEANKIIQRDFLVGLVTHCIQEIIKEFHINLNASFESEWFSYDFIVALSCYKSNQNHLLTFKMNFDGSDVKLTVDEIGKNDLAIIGITRYTNGIKKTFIHNKMTKTTSHILISELLKAVDDNESIDLREIGRPLVMKKFDRHRELWEQQKFIK